MNTKLAITSANIDQLHVPAKARTFLDKALAKGLTVEQVTYVGRTDGQSNYTISSRNPIDSWQLWITHTAGRNGGKLDLTRYTPDHPKFVTKKVTRAMATVTIDDMGDGLVRHDTREAEAAATVPTVDASIASALTAVPQPIADVVSLTPRAAAVQAVKEAAPAQVDATLVEEAKTALGTLKVNGRFAIRMAKTGAIPRSTTGTVRKALVNRDLVSQAGGVLTDLGAAVRALIMGSA